MDLNKAESVLRGGGIVIFPTDTVWGIGVKADDPEAVKKFYKIKRREVGKPSQVLVADLEQAKTLGKFNERTSELVNKYWPGALTVIVPAEGGGTVGLRMPAHELTRELCRRAGPIMAGSANFAGDPAPLKREELNSELVNKVDLVVEGECGGQPSSTVVDTTQEPWKIIRQGQVKVEL